jgi:hypothetical protein
MEVTVMAMKTAERMTDTTMPASTIAEILPDVSLARESKIG